MKLIVDYNWIRYKNVRDMCAAHGIKYSTYYYRMASCKRRGVKPTTKMLLR